MLKKESENTKDNTEYKKPENKYIKLIKDYKNEIIIGTLVVGVTIGAIYMFNKNGMEKLSYNKMVKSNNTLTKVTKGEKIALIEKVVTQDFKIGTEEVKLVSVKSHPRKLPSGYKPSAEKVSTAFENGFRLAENQTWVDSYTKLAS